MCTVAVHVGPQFLMIANRDEALDRPSSPPANRGEIFAPRDEVAGGTWWGVNRRRMLCAITNRFGHARDPDRKSRGLLVLDALHQGLVFHDGATITRRDLVPGWNVVTERSLTPALEPVREARVLAALGAHIPTPEEARAILSVHVTSDDPLAATCVHFGSVYGTRSSSYLALGPAPRLLHSEGPPCVTAPVDMSEALASFLG